MTYDAVVFDQDGVLVELCDWELFVEATRAAYGAFGVEPAEEDLHATAGTTTLTSERLRELCSGYDLDADAFWEVRDTNASLAQQAEIRDGRKPLYDDVDAVFDLDRPMGIVSSNQHATVEYVLEHYGMTDRFATFYGRRPSLDDIDRKKPRPYFIERALDDLGTHDALYVGDSESDVEAAHNAGIDSAFVRRPHRADLELRVEPTHELDDLYDLHDVVLS